MAMKTRILKEIEFNTPGEVVEGRLMAANIIRYKDGGMNVDYLVRCDGRGIVGFRGSSMLNKLLFADDLGKLVIITFRGLDAKPVADGMSPRKIFDVQVDEDSKVKFENGRKGDGDSGITDDDLPPSLR
jgi:hypothetical protein